MSRADKIRKWLRRNFPALYRRFGRYFHTYYPLQRRVVRHARRHPELYADADLAAAVKLLRSGGISVFSFPGYEKYGSLAVEVHTGDDGFPWVDHGGRRLYFRRGTAAASVASSYRALRMEQDPASPHFYRAAGFEVRVGDVLLDVGSAEGIYALDNVEQASRIVLFEVDPEWIGALEKTFAPWRETLTILNQSASDVDDAESATIDTVVREAELQRSPLLLKLDVEGVEERVLAGAEEVLSLPDTRAVVCTYHRHGDHERLSAAMRARGYEVRTSPGWMLFIHDKNLQPPFFRRGVIYCTK
jgi:hypothetical protein